MCCPLVFEFSVGIGGFVIGLGQISFFFSSGIEVKTVCKRKQVLSLFYHICMYPIRVYGKRMELSHIQFSRLLCFPIVM